MYRLLKYNIALDGTDFVNSASDKAYDDADEALAGAKALCVEFGWHILLTQDVQDVRMAPSVVSLVKPAPPPGPVYRGHAVPDQADDVPVVPRLPQAKPRLLIVTDRRATPAEIFGHLMVVAEGRIVKNAFGALEMGDMPLTGPEQVEVMNAMRGNIPSDAQQGA